ncbi:MAG: ABC transporter substrate-binding protein [Actinomycetota bacterium]
MNSYPRRKFLRLAAGVPAGLLAGKALAACSSGSSNDGGDTGASPAAGTAAGVSSAPIRLGFIALTDCASIVMAQELGYFKERGLNVEVIKQASWPATRDNLLSGQIDGAHCLFSMPVSLAAGIGGQPESRCSRLPWCSATTGRGSRWRSHCRRQATATSPRPTPSSRPRRTSVLR